jgi:hypothetical protein
MKVPCCKELPQFTYLGNAVVFQFNDGAQGRGYRALPKGKVRRLRTFNACETQRSDATARTLREF